MLASAWRVKQVANPVAGSIYADKRAASVVTSPKPGWSKPMPVSPLATAPVTVTLMRHTVKQVNELTHVRIVPSDREVTRPGTAGIHKQYHVGGSKALDAAGVRCTASTPASTPWMVPTGKPPGGWCVAGQMAEGW